MKERLNPYFCVTLQQSGASCVCITFARIIKKKYTIYRHLSLTGTDHCNSTFPKNLGKNYHWVLEKTTNQFFQYFRGSAMKLTTNFISGISWLFKSKIRIIHAATYITMFPLDLVYYITFFFLLFLPHIFYNSKCLIPFHYNMSVTLQK